jgi:hypothetical protein
MSRSRVLHCVTLAILLGGCGSTTAIEHSQLAEPGTGCTRADVMTTPDHVVSTKRQWGPAPLPIHAANPSDAALARALLPERIGGLPVRGVVDNGAVQAGVSYFGPVDVEGLTVPEFEGRGGIMLVRSVLAEGTGPEEMTHLLDGRVLRVEVGSHSGVAYENSPTGSGSTFSVVWSDDTYVNWLSGSGSADRLVNAARSWVCADELLTPSQ